jgi:hypothetical protein
MDLQSLQMQEEEEEDQNQKNAGDNGDQSQVTEVGREDSMIQGTGTGGDPGLGTIKTGGDQNLLTGIPG